MISNNFFMIFNESTNRDINVDIINRPSIPAPIEIVNEFFVEGKGKVYEHTGVYNDVVIPINFNYVDERNFNETWRKLKKWLLKVNNNELQFSDDLEYFYKVNKVEMSSNAREEMWEFGNTTVNFTVSPYQYLKAGQNEFQLPQKLNNEFEVSKPVYKILGEGLLTLNVNGNIITANVGQNLIIDTERELCYRIDGTYNNISLSGKYKDMHLKEGDNTFSYSGNFDIKIIPNWRCL